MHSKQTRRDISKITFPQISSCQITIHPPTLMSVITKRKRRVHLTSLPNEVKQDLDKREQRTGCLVVTNDAYEIPPAITKHLQANPSPLRVRVLSKRVLSFEKNDAPS